MSRVLLAVVVLLASTACAIDPMFGPSASSPRGSSTSFPVPALQPPPPTLTAISPSSAAPGAYVTVVITGSNFRQFDTRVTIDGKGVSVTAYSVKSATEMTASVSVEPKAVAGEHNVRLTTSGGTTEPQVFAVLAQ